MASKAYDWKILSLGVDKKMMGKGEVDLQSQGYKNLKVLTLNSTQESEEELMKVLKSQQWDAVTIGGYINGSDTTYVPTDENVPKDRQEVFFLFNRILNIIHQLAPNSKIILARSPQDIHGRIQSVMQEGNK